MADPFDILDGEQREALRAESQPNWTSPMLATLTHDTFSDPAWLYERKFDGVRCLVFRRDGKLRLMSRNKKRMNDTYPELVEDLGKESCDDFIADGEIVAFEGNRTSFSRLQQRIGIEDPEQARASGVAVYLYLFDVLHLDGRNTTRLPLRERKRLLKRAFSFQGHVRLTQYRVGRGEEYLKQACAKGWEGLIAKRADSHYEHQRSKAWLKLKCVSRQEFVIGGYTDPKGSRVGFGALLVGYYDGGDLRYAGKVGTGYDEELLRELGDRLEGIERSTCPFDDTPREKGVHWVTPKLVGEVGFTEWTRDGKLRHPRFLGLRPDKSAKQVVRERASSAPI